MRSVSSSLLFGLSATLLATSVAAQTPPPTGDPRPAAAANTPSPGAQATDPAQQAEAGRRPRLSIPGPTLTDEARRELGATPGEAAPIADEQVDRILVPPVFLQERTPTRTTRVVFPLFFQEQRLQSTTTLVPFYYRHRAQGQRTDVAFPFYWHWRGQRDAGGEYLTRVIPPFYYHYWHAEGEARSTAVGLAPLFFYGETWARDGSLSREHLIIPPLLTYHTWRPEHALTIAGPFYYNRERNDTDWGLAPLWFTGNNLRRRYLFIPPALTYYRHRHEDHASLTVVGPFWVRNSPDSFSINLAPLFFHRHNRTESNTTVLPLFHYDRGDYGSTLVTPLFGYRLRRDERLVVTPFYQQYRSLDYRFDSVAPFFFRSQEPLTGAHTEAVFPLFYHRATFSTNTWWVLPTAHYHRENADWYFNLYPLVFTGQTGPRRHTVIAPLYFDFQNEETHSRAMMVTPLFWRFSDPNSVTMLAGNFLWMSAVRQGVRSYEWHLLPIFSYARPRPEDLSWNVLFGLAGYRRAGTHRQIRVLWIPINLD